MVKARAADGADEKPASMNLRFLSELYAGFVRGRGLSHHFRRFPLLETLLRGGAGRELPTSMVATLAEASRSPIPDLLAALSSHPNGLTESQAAEQRAVHGWNQIGHEKPPRWWTHLWQCYRNPFNLLLTALATISYIDDDLKATIVIGSMVVLSTLIRFVQESRSNKAAEKLKEMVSTTATVLRRDPAEIAAEEARKYFHAILRPKPPRRIEVAIKQLVPGDVIALSAGDMLPADVRIISAKDLFVSQAAMTGESLPVEKFAEERELAGANPLERGNLAFMGTNVVSGSALAVVVTTGDRTYFGSLAQKVTAVDRTPTAFQTGVNQVSWLLIRFMLVMTPIVLLLNGLTKGDWKEAFLFSMSVAIGLTPEMLPMIVTSTLAKGAVFLSRKKVIVKRLDAIQNFGAMDVLCTDKTGTLTQDRIFLSRHLDAFGDDSETVLEYAYLNSYHQTGLKNLLDVAVLEHAQMRKQEAVAAGFRKIDEIPFDFTRRRMSVVVAAPGAGDGTGDAAAGECHRLICKGAVEEILAVCRCVRRGTQDEPLGEQMLARVRAVTADLNAEGLRVVAVAARESDAAQQTYGLGDERELTLIGYIAFLDPPKESTKPALDALAAHGIGVKILTGDNDLVTRKICREVGIDADHVVVGDEVEAMGDDALADAAERYRVFARLTPAHKERIVRALRARGHVTGFMGDGINDAPALRAADIGISVDSAVDIAKEAADIILLEKSLMVLEEGVIEGRRTFANMLKYIKMTASSNFGNVFSVLVAGAFLPFLPMLPLQLLVQNLLYDISQIAIPFDNVDAELVQRPQRWQPGEIGRFMVVFGPVSSVFDVCTFALMWWVFGATSEERAPLFQAGWFVEGLVTQTLIVHMIRTAKIPFVQSIAGTPLIVMTVAVIATGMFLVMGPPAPLFKFAALPLEYFAWAAMIILGYVALTQVVKRVYIRRYGWQ
jgi:Mg2+-importing ATPase